MLLLRLLIFESAFTHLGESDFCCCGDGMLSFLGELGREEDMLDLLLLLDEEFSSLPATTKRKEEPIRNAKLWLKGFKKT